MSATKSKGKDYRQQITTIYIFPNRMVAVFDQKGEQMPFFQGMKEDIVMKRIKDRIMRQRNKIVEWTTYDGVLK